MTLGEYRVGKSFNPSANPHVDEIKRMAAAFIDYRNDWNSGDNAEASRLVAIAQQQVEEAAMNGVKAVTKQPRD
jgi:hypothetical protein